MSPLSRDYYNNMRPDKKKTRHHDSLKCEAKAKQKAAEKTKKEQKAAEQQVNKKVKDKLVAAEVGNLDVASNTSSSLFSTSSSNFHQEVSEAYSHRKVSSNWTKYEIPSSGSDDESGTGPDYNFVLENSAGKAADHLQLQAEKDWELNHQEYNHDLFALNMTDLEAKLDAIPLYNIIDFREEDIDEATKQILDSYAKEGQQHWNDRLRKGDAFETLEDVTKKIVDTLKEKPKAPEENQAQSVPKGDEEDELEDWLNDYLS